MMTDSTTLDSPATMVEDDLQNPPAKRPCLDVPTASDAVDFAADEGSDFYNTPLNVGTPNPMQTSASVAENVISHPQTSPKPRPHIPGLSLCNGPDSDMHAPQSEEPPESNVPTSSLRQVMTASSISPTDAPLENSLSEAGTSAMDRSTVHKEESMVSSSVEGAHFDGPTPNDEQSCDATTLPTLAGVPQETIDFSKGTVPTAEGHTEENGEPEWEVDSSPYESSSSDSSDMSSSSDESDKGDEAALMDPEEQARILMAEGGSDDEGDGKDGKKVARTIHEKEEEAVPIPDITITPEVKVELLGSVQSIVDNVALITANISGEYQVLEAGSVLCLADLKVIGVVSETLGKVERPMYTVRFSSAVTAKEMGVDVGVPVFYAADHSTFVFTQPLKGLKGSDASNLHDEEVGDEEIEFSDDEAEAEFKRQQKLKRQQRKDGRGGLNSNRRGRRGAAAPQPSGLRNSELSYDDVNMEDGYTPLARPKNYHEMMNAQEPPLEESHPQSAKSFRGSRGRGRARGRGRDRGGSHPGRGAGYQTPESRYPYSSEPNNPPNSHSSPASYDHLYSHTVQQQQFGSPSNHFQQPAQMSQAAGYPNPPFPMQFSPQPFPFAQALQQQHPSQYPPPGSHVNPAFFATHQQHGNLQQQQQQQQQHQQQPFTSSSSQPQESQDTFAAAQAQLELLRRLSRGGT